MDLKELPDGAFARHPWETVRADFFLRVLGDHVAGTSLRALDVGAGDAYFARRLVGELPAVARATCFDPGYTAAWITEKAQGDPRLDFTADRPQGAFDLVLLLDVLEHADDDQALLADGIASAARSGGWLLLSAPAHPLLSSRHDQALGHRRRYAPAKLRTLAAKGGLEVVEHGQLFTSLLLPRALAKLGELGWGGGPLAGPAPARIVTALGSWHHGAMLTSAATRLLALDAQSSRLAARWRLPLPGLSTWLLARRR